MIFTVTGQTPLTDTVYRLELAGDTAAITRPGQFVQIKVPGFYLRRPISVCDWGENSLTLIYHKAGGPGHQGHDQPGPRGGAGPARGAGQRL